MARSKSSGASDAAKSSKQSSQRSDDPTKQGRVAQLRAIFTMTRATDPAVVWWMLGALAATVVVGFLLGTLLGHPIYLTILAVPLGAMIALVVMTRRAERAAYARAEGQPGASLMALQGLRRGWSVEQKPVSVDPRTNDVVFRAVGRPGVVLVTEGPVGRATKLATTERKRVARVLGANVPITVVMCGEGEGQIPLRKLSSHIMRMKPAITKGEVSEVAKRLRALGALQPPIPKGIDPTKIRPDRRAARGR